VLFLSVRTAPLNMADRCDKHLNVPSPDLEVALSLYTYCLFPGCTRLPVPKSPYCAIHKEEQETKVPVLRTFETGATRDNDLDKPDYEGYLSPLVIERFGMYMLKHQFQSDGTKRESDNWQKGISLSVYMKSLLRHVINAWKRHRGYGPTFVANARDPQSLEEDLCAILFNASGFLHEILKKKLMEGAKA
jgi:hypothetical protein